MYCRREEEKRWSWIFSVKSSPEDSNTKNGAWRGGIYKPAFLMAVRNQLGCFGMLPLLFLKIDFNLNTDFFDKINTMQCYSGNNFSNFLHGRMMLSWIYFSLWFSLSLEWVLLSLKKIKSVASFYEAKMSVWYSAELCRHEPLSPYIPVFPIHPVLGLSMILEVGPWAFWKSG